MSKLLNRRLAVAFFLPIALFALDACRTAGIKDAYMSRDSTGRIKSDEFKLKNTEIHCLVEFVSGRDDVILKARLSAPEGSKAKIAETEITPGKGKNNIDIKLITAQGGQDSSESATGPWDRGVFHIDLYIDDEYDRTLPFEVCNFAGEDCTADTDCCGAASRGSKCTDSKCVDPPK